MSDIVLSSGARFDLPASQHARNLTIQTQPRPAAGKWVNFTLENRAVLLTASNTDGPAGGYYPLLEILPQLSPDVASATGQDLIEGIDTPPFAIGSTKTGLSAPSSVREAGPFFFGLVNANREGLTPPAPQVSLEPRMPALSPAVRAEQAVLQFF